MSSPVIKCRICLIQKSPEECKSVFRKHGSNLLTTTEMLKICVPLLEFNFVTYDYICLQCSGELRFCLKFIEKCIIAEKSFTIEKSRSVIPPDTSSLDDSSIEIKYIPLPSIVEANPNIEVIQKSEPEDAELIEETDALAFDDTPYISLSEDEADKEPSEAKSTSNRQPSTEKKGYQCDKCSKTFLRPKGLRDHQIRFENFPECAFKCSKCNKKCNTYIGYSAHKCFQDQRTVCTLCTKWTPKGKYFDHLVKEHMSKSVDSDEKVSCQDCGREFSSEENLKVHQLIHDGFPFKQCDKCENILEDEISLNDHLESVHGVVLEVDRIKNENLTEDDSNTLNRTDSGAFLLLDTSLVKEERDDGKKKVFPCYICERKFPLFSRLVHHFVQTSIHRQDFPCRWCDVKTRSLVELKEHLAYTHKYGIVCDKCFAPFSTQEKLDEHLKNYEGKGKPCGFFICEKCNRRFWEQTEYEKHLEFIDCECKRCPSCFKLIATDQFAAHLKEHQPFCCAVCGNRFSSSDVLHRHIKLQHQAGYLPCPKCQKLCKDNMALKTHMRSMHNTYSRKTTQLIRNVTPAVKQKGKPVACPYCKKLYRSRSEMITHVVTRDAHANDFPCNVCENTFTTFVDVKNHLREDHKLQHFCEACFASFEDEAKLENHIRIYASNKSKPCGFWTCEKCGQRFPDKSSLEIHTDLPECQIKKNCNVCNKMFTVEELKTHTHQEFICELCGKSFQSRAALRTHLKIKAHITGEEMVMCELCGNSFTKQYLNAHKKITHKIGEKNKLKCSYCTLQFFYPQQLKAHEKVHTNTKDVQCTACDKMFRTNHNMNLHYRTVHLKLKPIKCKECGHEFSKKGNMLTHMRVHMPNRERAKSSKPRFRKRKYKLPNNVVDMPIFGLQRPPDDPGLRVKCHFCSKILKCVYNLAGHVRNSHAKLRRFKCHLCEMTFITKVTLEKHLKLHEDPLFQFRCKVCYKRSRSAEEFANHAKKHTKLDFHCDKCPEKFAREYLLEIHKESVHPDPEENVKKYKEMLKIAYDNLIFVDREEKQSKTETTEAEVDEDLADADG